MIVIKAVGLLLDFAVVRPGLEGCNLLLHRALMIMTIWSRWNTTSSSQPGTITPQCLSRQASHAPALDTHNPRRKSPATTSHKSRTVDQDSRTPSTNHSQLAQLTHPHNSRFRPRFASRFSRRAHQYSRGMKGRLCSPQHSRDQRNQSSRTPPRQHLTPR